MADISVTPKPHGQFTWIWALLAIAAALGLMLWLGAQSREIDAAANAAADSAAIAAGADDQGVAAEAVDLAAVATAPDSYIGRPLAISGVTVAASLGPRGFWADIAGANPFLVIVAPEVPNPELAVVGQTVNLQGTVAPVTEGEIDAFVQDGSLNAAARDEASFATHYLLATQVAQ